MTEEERNLASLEAREALEAREDYLFELRRFEPCEGFGPMVPRGELVETDA